jgi:hypothetical protein
MTAFAEQSTIAQTLGNQRIITGQATGRSSSPRHDFRR